MTTTNPKDIANTHAQNPHVVDVINAAVTSNPSVHHVQNSSSSRVLPSSNKGRLKKPHPNLLQRYGTTERRHPYGMAPSPEPAMTHKNKASRSSPIIEIVQASSHHPPSQTVDTHLNAATSPTVQNQAQPIIAEDTQSPQFNATGLVEPPTPASKEQQSPVGMSAQDFDEAAKFDADHDSEDDIKEFENRKNELNRSKDIHMPGRLDEALEFAHKAEKTSFKQNLSGINIPKSYGRLKKLISRWQAEKDHSNTKLLITLTNKVTKDAKTLFEWSGSNETGGLDHTYQQVLPTIVRMLYISLLYHLSTVGRTIKRLSYEQLRESRAISKAIIDIAHRARTEYPEFVCPRFIISMIRRIKDVLKILEKHQIALNEAQKARSRVERQQAQQIRQRADDVEEAKESELKNWRERWRILHDQRLGAELQGRIFLGPGKDQHLKLIPLDNTSITCPSWDPHLHLHSLMEGLQEFAGPDVYRNIFRKYCRHGGPLQAFNVSEIVDKAVSLRNQLIKKNAEEGKEQEQWVSDIFDPRLSPTALV